MGVADGPGAGVGERDGAVRRVDGAGVGDGLDGLEAVPVVRSTATATQRPYLDDRRTTTRRASAAVSRRRQNATVDTLTPTLWADMVDPADDGHEAVQVRGVRRHDGRPTGCVERRARRG